MLIDVTAARVVGPHSLELAFEDGTSRRVDLSRVLIGPVFEPLRDPAYFALVRVEDGTVTWPNGADFAPEFLYDYDTEAFATGEMWRAVRERVTSAELAEPEIQQSVMQYPVVPPEEEPSGAIDTEFGVPAIGLGKATKARRWRVLVSDDAGAPAKPAHGTKQPRTKYRDVSRQMTNSYSGELVRA